MRVNQGTRPQHFLLQICIVYLPLVATARKRQQKTQARPRPAVADGPPRSPPLTVSTDRSHATFEAAFSVAECKQLLARSRSLAVVQGNVDGTTDSGTRRSDIRWLPQKDFPWVYQRVARLLGAANRDIWGYKTSASMDQIQVGTYRAEVHVPHRTRYRVALLLLGLNA
jgi:hypothetical protein